MIYEKVIELLTRLPGINSVAISPDTHIIKDLGADSLDIAEFFMSLEEEFNILIPEKAAAEMLTAGQTADYIEKLIRAGG